MKKIILVLTLSLTLGTHLQAEVKLPAMFSDHMVLQQQKVLPVWGWDTPGSKIIVSLAGQTASATANSESKWQVKLAPLTASARPEILKVSGTTTIEVQDVLVGEVWLCSGQSNMEWPLNRCTNATAAIASSSDSLLRLLVIPKMASDKPMADVKASWTQCDSNSVTNFSGVGYFFGRELRRDLNVPVGLIGSYYGGTPAEAWTDRETLASAPELNAILEAQAKAVAEFDPKKMAEENKKIKADHDAAVAKALAEGKPKPGGGYPKVPPKTDKNRPAGLYDGMIAPLQPFAMRGVIWYQGESNSRQPLLYKKLFPAMIAAWRNQWGEGAFPFLFVQLASYTPMSPEIREAQFLSWQSTTNTAMVVTTDVGNPDNIHPTDKEPVGKRLALTARALAYGQKIEYSGPAYDGMSVRKDHVVISFKHTGGGLVAKGGPLRGFTIAGADEKFVPAEAKIKGKSIEVFSEQVPIPVAVRYNWAGAPDGNLYNRDGLPASPFRTDAWETPLLKTEMKTASTTSASASESVAQRDARMAWWRDARFGMFIHWGVYSVPDGYYQGKPLPGIGEWIMFKAKIPMAEYLLADRKDLAVNQSGNSLNFSLPTKAPDKIASVVCLEIADSIPDGAKNASP